MRKPYNLFVARPVSKSEYRKNDLAMSAYWKEWTNLEKKQVWRWDTVIEWDQAKAYHAKPANHHPQYKGEVHFGFLFGIMVERVQSTRITIPGSTTNTEWYFRAIMLKTRTGILPCSRICNHLPQAWRPPEYATLTLVSQVILCKAATWNKPISMLS